MTHLGQNRTPWLRSIIRDVVVVVLAEVLVLGLAWFFSRHGKAILTRLFGAKRQGNANSMTTATAIDV